MPVIRRRRCCCTCPPTTCSSPRTTFCRRSRPMCRSRRRSRRTTRSASMWRRWRTCRRGSPDRTLVLPGHRLPFFGLHRRCAELAAHHAARCADLARFCDPVRSADRGRDRAAALHHGARRPPVLVRLQRDPGPRQHDGAAGGPRRSAGRCRPAVAESVTPGSVAERAGQDDGRADDGHGLKAR